MNVRRVIMDANICVRTLAEATNVHVNMVMYNPIWILNTVTTMTNVHLESQIAMCALT